jgi:hypothetical protein
MAATKGNQFWKARARHGRSKIFSTPNKLWDAACEYFQWAEDNPLQKAIIYQGVVTGQEDLLRAMTISGLCIFLGVNNDYMTEFKGNLDLEKKQDKDFSRVIKNIYEVIKTQKFEGASAGLLNPNIIARDLGLTDKKELSGSVENPLTLVIQEISGNTLGPSND